MQESSTMPTDVQATEAVTIEVALTAKIVAAFLTNNAATVTELPTVIRSVYRALIALATPAPAPEAEKPVPAVSIKRSVTPDYIVCLEDGKKLKMLKRHLFSTYNLTPDEYRAKWGLPPDYPMVAPSYAAQRSSLAKAAGLGRKAAPAPVVEAAPTKRAGRPKKSAA